MKKLLNIFAIIFATAYTFAAHAAAPTVTSRPIGFVPFEIADDGKIYVDITIEPDTVPLRFMVDTGASDNIINSRSANALRHIDNDFKSVDNVTATTSVKNLVTPYKYAINIGPARIDGQRFVVAPSAENLDGILGWNALGEVDFYINYNTQRIYFFRKGMCEISDPSAWTPLYYRSGLPTIVMPYNFVDVSGDAVMVLDSGSDRVADFHTAYIAEQNLDQKQKAWGVSSIVGLDGAKTYISEMILDSATFGYVTLWNIPVGLNSSNSGLAANPDINGIVGNNLLQRFNQVWSRENRRLALIPNRRIYSTPYKPLDHVNRNKVTLKSHHPVEIVTTDSDNTETPNTDIPEN